MKKILVTFISILISISAISQDIQYRKDDRSQNVKEDRFNEYKVNSISETDILKALEMAGVRIFDIPISPVFEKEYNLSVILDEYVDGEKVNSQDIIYTHRGKNVYIYFTKAPMEEESVPYFDYIPKLTFFSKDNDTTLLLTTEHYGGSSMRPLKKNKVEEWQRQGLQPYWWRTYSKTDWKLNEEVPLLVYASSWYDERFNLFRFCSVVDLSLNEEETKELFDNTPHCYVISLKIYE